MPAFTLAEIVEATKADVRQRGKEAFGDIVTDTRKIAEGVLFLALKGERFDGEDFAAEAVEKGAAGIMVSRACPEEKLAGIAKATVFCVEDTQKAYQQLAHHWRMRFSLPVIAITGSNGKTTTKDLTAAVLSAKHAVLKTQANFNNEIGLPMTLLRIAPEHDAAVVEIGMRGLGQIAALAPIAAPSIGVVTNVGETHIELLGSIENIAKAKAELVEAIPSGGTVVLNADNARVAAMREKAKQGVRVITFGMDEAADVYGSDAKTEGQTTTFTVKYAGNSHEFHMPMIGHHNVCNALAALSVGFSLGLSAEEMQDGLETLETTKMRFEYQTIGECTIINDAYNASPMSMSAAIRTVAESVKGRKVAVVGDMLELGDIAAKAHRHVGEELAENHFAAVVAYGELAKYIAEGAKAHGLREVRHCTSHAEAAEVLRGLLQPGDTVLLKGSRGMRMEKIIELL